MGWLFGAFLVAAISGAATGEMSRPAKSDSETGNALDQAARSGNLALVTADGRSIHIREVEVMGCLVAFKTKIDETGFTARIAELGDGSVLELHRLKNEVQFQSTSGLAEKLTLRSKQPIDSLFKALTSVREACRAGKNIF